MKIKTPHNRIIDTTVPHYSGESYFIGPDKQKVLKTLIPTGRFFEESISKLPLSYRAKPKVKVFYLIEVVDDFGNRFTVEEFKLLAS